MRLILAAVFALALTLPSQEAEAGPLRAIGRVAIKTGRVVVRAGRAAVRLPVKAVKRVSRGRCG